MRSDIWHGPAGEELTWRQQPGGPQGSAAGGEGTADAERRPPRRSEIECSLAKSSKSLRAAGRRLRLAG